MSEYNPKNPDEFKQVQIEEPAPAPLNIVPTPSGSQLESGEFASPNFRTGRAGWRFTSDGDLEANDGNFRGDITGATGTFSGSLSGGLGEITETLTAGENVALGDAVSIGDGLEYLLVANTSTGADEVIRNTAWWSQSFTTSAGAKSIGSVSLNFSYALGDPQNVTGTMTIHIYANSGGAPTGSSLGSQAFVGSTGSLVKTTFATPVTVSPSTLYHIVVVSTNGDNNIRIRKGAGAGTGVNKSTDSGANWVADNGPFYHSVYEIDSTAGQIMKSTAVGPTRARDKNFVGFANEAITSGSSGEVIVGGAFTTTGLTAGVIYYLSDTRGAIATSAGSVSRKIGLSLTTTKILIVNSI